MPIYHFHVRNGHVLFDPHGIDLPDANAAVQHGNQLAKSFVGTGRTLDGGGSRSDWHVHVTDEEGNTLGRFGVPAE